ncbi:TIGR03943 family protein [Cnuibacter physcomitrellae]|uniref:TIGR03943 family putative permease subunit n=1 Tax=Cnuibacter physcomitrellae TaxID=1619308 RepID=UPI0021761C3B|nr:TIGR03943 family protein [Cnuibacter physcomitrellae]MCS5498846.1 TIGR03943 family protein [Cnuibacter physcomitrellae]
MSADRLASRWVGLVLVAVTAVATLWLATTGRLDLYVHPRYTVFVVVMALLALAATIAAAVLLSFRDEAHTHGHGGHGHAPDGHLHGDDHGGDGPHRRAVTRIAVATGSAVLVAVSIAALVLAPPRTLSVSAAAARADSVVGAVQGASDPSGDPSGYTVKDWSNLLRQGRDDEVIGERTQLTGFVQADPDDPDSFALSRFVITCCAVDARPTSVTVYSPGWSSSLRVGDWATVDGTFAANPSVLSMSSVALLPSSVVPVDEPLDPYLQ